MKLFLVQTGQTWTLKPGREYVVGNGPDSDIPFPSSESKSVCQLKFGMDNLNSWHVEALGITNAFINNQGPLTRTVIKEQSQIILAKDITLIATPAGTAPTPPTSSPQSTRPYPTQNPNPSTPTQSDYLPGSQLPSSIYTSRNDARTINLGFRWFKISSPDDGVGLELSDYSLFQTYGAKRSKVQQVCEHLYEHVLAKVNEGCVGDSKIIPFIYKKGLDDRRKFIRISRDTVHGVRTTIFIRFLSYGDNLYIGLNVYVLGSLNLVKFLFKGLLTLGLFWSLLNVAPPIMLFLGILIILLWWKLLWRISYEGKLGLAFRQEFPGGMGEDLFNIDDMAMFAKSTVHLTVTAIHEVFDKEGLPVESLDAYIQQINNISIDTGGGDIISSAIGAASKILGNQSTVDKI